MDKKGISNCEVHTAAHKPQDSSEEDKETIINVTAIPALSFHECTVECDTLNKLEIGIQECVANVFGLKDDLTR